MRMACSGPVVCRPESVGLVGKENEWGKLVSGR